jgi:hypothetical protein
VSTIQAVVAMVPHEIAGEGRSFVVEKPGLDVTRMNGHVEEMIDQ